MIFETLFLISAMSVTAVISRLSKITSRLGIKEGKLAPCPKRPNCVSSQTDDPLHRIEPITYDSSPAFAHAALVDIIKNMKRSEIVAERDNYVYAEFKSAIFRFVDDVEFYFEEKKNIIHVRSASRIGYSDLGVNRNRIEKIRKLFQERELRYM